MEKTAALGVKRRCLTCSSPFFDLARTPIVCPKCAAVFEVIEWPRSTRRLPPAPMKRPDLVVAPLAEEDADTEEAVEENVEETETDDAFGETETIEADVLLEIDEPDDVVSQI